MRKLVDVINESEGYKMRPDLRNKIRLDNIASTSLQKAGYSLQGRTNNNKNVAVVVNGKIELFDDYPHAASVLLKK